MNGSTYRDSEITICTDNKTEMTEKKVIGKCPVCGGNVIETTLGFCCDGTTKAGARFVVAGLRRQVAAMLVRIM